MNPLEHVFQLNIQKGKKTIDLIPCIFILKNKIQNLDSIVQENLSLREVKISQWQSEFSD